MQWRSTAIVRRSGSTAATWAPPSSARLARPTPTRFCTTRASSRRWQARLGTRWPGSSTRLQPTRKCCKRPSSKLKSTLRSAESATRPPPKVPRKIPPPWRSPSCCGATPGSRLREQELTLRSGSARRTRQRLPDSRSSCCGAASSGPPLWRSPTHLTASGSLARGPRLQTPLGGRPCQRRTTAWGLGNTHRPATITTTAAEGHTRATKSPPGSPTPVSSRGRRGSLRRGTCLATSPRSTSG
mmetsp:Transcript_1553/g.6175  ORF Transcript_1553/g.6175 Transcript_1553/m.6175 type:complete len:242 (-) Transcript_1553:340-1065(-)